MTTRLLRLTTAELLPGDALSYPMTTWVGLTRVQAEGDPNDALVLVVAVEGRLRDELTLITETLNGSTWIDDVSAFREWTVARTES